MTNILKEWKTICNHNSSPNGRIWICWDPASVSVALIDESTQVMHCKVQGVDNSLNCVVSVVYGEHFHRKREELWADLVPSLDSRYVVPIRYLFTAALYY